MSIIWHRDGVEWHEAALPRRWHRCFTQSSGYIDNNMIERCPCGAVRLNGHAWIHRNERRKMFSPSEEEGEK